MHARTRDLYEALALPVGEDETLCKALVQLLEVQEKCYRAPLSWRQCAVLQGLFAVMHLPRDEKGQRLVGDLTKVINANLGAAGQTLSLSSREVGAIMTSLGFTDRKRGNTGWQMNMSTKACEQVHSMFAAYQIGLPAGLSIKECQESCELCKRLPIG